MSSYESSTKATNQSSTSSYFSYPVKYAVTNALRRLSTDPFPRSRSQSREPPHSSLSSLSGYSNGTQTPPPRRRVTPPYQPPPLTPISLSGYKTSTSTDQQLLTRQLAEEIRLLIPPRLQLVENWRLLFSLDQDGSSLATLFDKCTEHASARGGFVLVLRDAKDGVFGAYLTDAPRPSAGHYYGHGECFLWRATTLPSLPTLTIGELPPRPSEDTTDAVRSTTIAGRKSSLARSDRPTHGELVNAASRSGDSTPDRIRFKAFPYSGSNDYLIFCEHGFFSIGGGDGHYGLWIDASLENGVSEHCPTFGNEALSDEGAKFDVMGVELWYIGA